MAPQATPSTTPNPLIPSAPTPATPQVWEISDIDGSNKRTVTIAQYRAELDAAKVRAMAAFKASSPGCLRIALALEGRR
jgi:hypothetical protein